MLSVINRQGSKRYKHKMAPLWLCQCDCGTKCLRTSQVLTRKVRPAKSCGCLQVRRTVLANTKHGMNNSIEYSSWTSMKDRCLNENSKDFPKYGAIGISVCERWMSFENFYSDMGPRSSPDHSIGRIDNSGNYEPDNCRWMSAEEQNNNRLTSNIISLDGEALSPAQWERRFEFSVGLVSSRLRRGWTIRKALTTPTQLQFSRGQKNVNSK